MPSEQGDKIRLQHILDAIEEIQKYLVAVELPLFLENSMMRFACIKQMEIIGEASNHLSTELKSFSMVGVFTDHRLFCFLPLFLQVYLLRI